VKTLNLEETAKLLKVHIETVSRLAKTGQLPGAKIGRAWVFLEEDLIEYLREQIQVQQTMRVEESKIRDQTDSPKSPTEKQARGRRPVFMDV
jgi:excisionase family DNA binding protein